jgi:NAD(P)-dependent dehydrogenase (short-subunit alcohol dehydrogenase family)
MSKNNHWTIDNIPDQSGRIAIVTGANSGIGYETARALAYKGATVIMACRCPEKGPTAARQIEAENLAGTVEFMALDLAEMDSVQQFAATFSQKYDRLDLLINNAGVMMLPKRQETPDGYEKQFATNHLGHFALTGLLIETVASTPGARVINISSTAARMGRVNFDDLNAKQAYSPTAAYGQSKVANLLFTYELGRRLAAAGVDTLVVAAHPGWTTTNLQQHSALRFLNPLFAQGPEMGALPTLYAATAPEAKGGAYYGPEGFMQMRGYPVEVSATERSRDPVDAQKLWTISEQLTGVRFLSEKEAQNQQQLSAF